MKLNVRERIAMLDLLPEQGGMIDMILVRSISEKVALTAKDITDFSVKQEGNSVTWDQAKDTGIEIDFEESEMELLKGQVKELDENKRVTMRTFDLCMKIKSL